MYQHLLQMYENKFKRIELQFLIMDLKTEKLKIKKRPGSMINPVCIQYLKVMHTDHLAMYTRLTTTIKVSR